MLSQCLSTFVGCFVSRDYSIPEILYVRPISLTTTEDSLTLLYETKNEQNTMYLLHTDPETYRRAVQSLQEFLKTDRCLHVQYVTSPNKFYKVLTDVEEYIEDLTPNNAITIWENGFNPALLLRDDKHSHFTYSSTHGPIYWIAALRTGERGNRFPVDERFANVVKHKTLVRLLTNKV